MFEQTSASIQCSFCEDKPVFTACKRSRKRCVMIAAQAHCKVLEGFYHPGLEAIIVCLLSDLCVCVCVCVCVWSPWQATKHIPLHMHTYTCVHTGTRAHTHMNLFLSSQNITRLHVQKVVFSFLTNTDDNCASPELSLTLN